MGIFSQKPKIPDPYISIVFDTDCQGPRCVGSNISGTVKIQSPVPRRVELAQVWFFGHAMTHSCKSEGSGNNSRTVYFRDDARLFQLEQNVFADIWLPQEQMNSGRFQFQFPYSCGGLQGPSPYTGRTATSGIYMNDTHPLPPSFNLTRTSTEYAIVEYKVQVMVKFLDSAEPFVVDFDPFNFAPDNPLPQEVPFSEFVRASEKYSSSRLIGEAKSFGHSFRDRFSSQTPSVNVAMKATIPPCVTTSGSFPIYACIEIDSFSAAAIDLPLIDIKIKWLKLCQYTFYRSLRCHGVTSYGREHQATYEELVPLNTVPEWRQVERQYGKTNDRSFTYFPAAFEARIPGDTCPSFRTFNINHNFQLEFKLEATICEKKFEFKVEVPNVIVFST